MFHPIKLPNLICKTYNRYAIFKEEPNRQYLVSSSLQARVMPRKKNALLSQPSKNNWLKISWETDKSYTWSWREAIGMSCVWSHSFLLGCSPWRYQVIIKTEAVSLISSRMLLHPDMITHCSYWVASSLALICRVIPQMRLFLRFSYTGYK